MSYDVQMTSTTDTTANYTPSTQQQGNIESEEENYFSSNTPESSSTSTDVDANDLDKLNEMKKQEELEYWQNYAKQAKKVAETAQKHTESLEKVGVLGMVANLFTGGADKVTDEINQLDGNSTDEEIQVAEESIKEREATEKVIVGTELALLAAGTGGAAVAVAGGVAAIGAGTATILAGASGAAGSIYAHQLDHATNEVEGDTFQDVNEVIHDGVTGFVSGSAAPITQAVAGSVSTAVGAGLGLENGVILAADGTANVFKTMAATAFANGSGQAVASAAVAGVGYVADVATDKDKEFSGKDMLTATGIGAGIGFGLGTVTGALQGHKAADIYNNLPATKAKASAYNLLKDKTVYETYSNANDVKAYRFNPNGSPEDVLANNPYVNLEAETGKYYINTSWGEKYYIEGENMVIFNDAKGTAYGIKADIFNETYVDGASYHTNGAKQYLDPTKLEYGKVIDATKQAPARFAVGEVGTVYESLEGPATLQPESVLMVDTQGNLYQNTLKNLFSKNQFTDSQKLDTCVQYLKANPSCSTSAAELYKSCGGSEQLFQDMIKQLDDYIYYGDYGNVCRSSSEARAFAQECFNIGIFDESGFADVMQRIKTAWGD